MRLSIVVPVYNIEPYLEQCVNSLINQDFCDYEIILVDDGSKDRCPQICDGFAKKSDRIRVVHKMNSGLVSARRAGVEVAEGQYIGYVDGDDWVEPNFCSTVNRYIEEYAPDLINFNFYNNANGKDYEEKPSKFWGLYNKKELKEKVYCKMLCDREEPFFTFGIMPNVWNKVFKADLLKANLCTDDSITFGEDVASSYFCILDADTVYFANDFLYHYRRNLSSMTKAYNRRMPENCKHLLDYLDSKITANEYCLQEQKQEYKSFVLFKCILNEARAQVSVRKKSIRLAEKLSEYGWTTYIDRMSVNEYPAAYKVFFGLVKRKHYSLLMLLSSILLRIHR